MMKIPVGVAKKINQLVAGESLPASSLNHAAVARMIQEGAIAVRIMGRSRRYLYIPSGQDFRNYLKNNWGIGNLEYYIHNLEQGVSRAENVVAATDSKSRSIRTFKGFLVNCCQPVEATINSTPFVVQPLEGIFTYIHDFESFCLPEDVTVVGIENGENFRHLKAQAPLFQHIKPLFVSRYPQSNDLISWLSGIPNSYLHFGDFDFEGIRIYFNEYQKHLGGRASFFIPENIEYYLEQYGNRSLYNRQMPGKFLQVSDPQINHLVQLFHKHKKCLEQEVFGLRFQV